MKKVFISYSWEHDTENANKIYDSLHAFSDRFDVWMDSKSLPPGMEWKPAIIKEIRDTDYFIAVLSPGSVKVRKAMTHYEMKEALEVLKEFGPNEVFLIPARVKECTSPYESVAKFNYVNLFPNWDIGMKKMLETLDNSIFIAKKKTNIIKKKSKKNNYHYKIGIVDIDGDLKSIRRVVTQLNKAQNYFYFSLPQIESLNKKTKVIENLKNFYVSGISESYIKRNKLRDIDFVACFTKLPLAFDQDDCYLYNYFSGASDHDERFMFFSTDQLSEFSEKAKKKYEEGLVYILLGQLINFFTKSGFHHETKGCPLDFCEVRADITKGFIKRKICKECNNELPNGDLKNAINTLLKWSYK